MRRVFTSLAALFAVTTVGLVVVPATVAGADPGVPAGATVVGTAGPNCSSPSFGTIQAAIDAASANDTIYVCPGTYNESLTVNKPLTIDGAQYGVDARTRSVPDESVLNAPDGIVYTAGATSGTISGFTLQGFASGVSYIDASNVGSGWAFTDNILDVSNGGIYVNTDGITSPAASTISDNQFIQSAPSAASSGYAGQAVSVWGNTGNNISISNNSFTNLSGPGAGINTTGTGSCGSSLDTSNFSNNLTISGNTFTDNGASFTDPNYGPGFIDENFLALFCSNNAQISNNTVTITDANDANAETPVYMGGGDWNSSVTGNQLVGNGASAASGIQLNSNFYAPGTGVNISTNTASGFYYGIHVTGSNFGGNFTAPTGYTVSHNSISGSLENGIQVNPGADNSDSPSGAISGNTSTGSAVFDCFDSTTGSGTSGTADTWTTDNGLTSSPAGLCQAATTTSTTPTTSTFVLGGSNTDKATVNGNSTSGSPTGTVTFYECGPTASPAPCTSTAHIVGSAVHVTAGPANTATATSVSFTPTGTGYWCFSGHYSGDGNYVGSSDTTTGECFHVTIASSSTSSTPGATSVVFGQNNYDTVTVTGGPGGSPTGPVQFYVCGPTSVPTPCTSTANPESLDELHAGTAPDTGVATTDEFTPSSSGYWCFAADYLGSSNYTASSDATTDECFFASLAPTAITTSPTNTTINLGQSSTDSAKVTGGNAVGGSPAGTVSFYECGPTTTATPCTSKSSRIGSPVAVTKASGYSDTATSASFTPSAVGYWCYAAYYSGNTQYASSSDAVTNECVNVKGPVTILTKSLPSAKKGHGYSTTLAARGGTTPYTWSHTGSLPRGIKMNNSTGVISGTPSVTGSFPITVKVRDSGKPATTATQNLTIVVNS